MSLIEKRVIERDQARSGVPGSKLPTCKIYNEVNFFKNIFTTTNLAMSESDISVSLPSGSQAFTLQQ